MSIIRLDDRGQISAEYLLLFVVILVVFGVMINNFIAPTIDASNNVSTVSDTKAVIESIADAMNVVYANGPGAKRTVNIHVPQNMNLTFDSTNDVVITNLANMNYTNNGTLNTNKSISAPMNYNGIVNPSGTPNQLQLNTSGWYTVQVYWDPTSGNFIVNATKTS